MADLENTSNILLILNLPPVQNSVNTSVNILLKLGSNLPDIVSLEKCLRFLYANHRLATKLVTAFGKVI